MKTNSGLGLTMGGAGEGHPDPVVRRPLFFPASCSIFVSFPFGSPPACLDPSNNIQVAALYVRWDRARIYWQFPAGVGRYRTIWTICVGEGGTPAS